MMARHQHDAMLFYQDCHKTCNGPLVNHANKLRINLRSKDLIQAPASRHGKLRRGAAPRPFSAEQPLVTQVYGRTGSATLQRITSAHHPTTTYIHNIVIPLNRSTTTNSSPYPTTYMSNSQSGLKPKNHEASAVSHLQTHSRVNSATFDKYSTTSPRERSAISRQSASNPHNASGQMMRYEMEQQDRLQCRTRKKTATVRPHRVDRMYYMTGNNVNIQSKFRVEDEELERLRELSRARKTASYYGRGLSSAEGFVDSEETPHQPPPSSLGDAEAIDDPEDLTGSTEVIEKSEVENGSQEKAPSDSVSDGGLTGRNGETKHDDIEDPNSDTFVTQQMDELSLNEQLTGEMDESPSKQEQNNQSVNSPTPENIEQNDNDSGVENASVKSAENKES